MAGALLAAERAVVLTGLHLGGPEALDVTHSQGDWAKHASLEMFLTDPAGFWAFGFQKACEIANRTVGPGHSALARLGRSGLVHAIVTQAVDRLHVRAGSPNVVEVHGTVLTARCERCRELYGLDEIAGLLEATRDGVPRCSQTGCGYPLRPAATLWGEPLASEPVRAAWELATETDCLIVVDCELRTAPISLLPSVPLTRGVPLVMIGETPTHYDRYAKAVLREPSETVLVSLADLLALE